MSLVDYAESELRRAGLFDKDSDYGGMLGDAVMALVRTHADQGHSGFSHGITIRIFNEVVNYRPLSPITSDPAEWMEVEAGKMWQSKRKHSVFSNDGGTTWYDIDEPGPP